MEWKAQTYDDLKKLISESETQLSESETKLWNLIKIVPQKWAQHPWGDEGKGFWAVAIFGNRVIYYNDIEEGFNCSAFQTFGTIDEYFCDDLELRTVIHNLFSS